MSDSDSSSNDATYVARVIGIALEKAGCEYALGGAIALGFWGVPRGTLDVDVTLFLPANESANCVRLLEQIGCSVRKEEVRHSLAEHGFCQVEFGGRRIDVFLPTIPFYELAKERRRQVVLAGHPIQVWDAETLCVFKMMFFRLKDLADVEQVIRAQGSSLDRAWVESQLTTIYGRRDPRVARWQELLRQTDVESGASG